MACWLKGAGLAGGFRCRFWVLGWTEIRARASGLDRVRVTVLVGLT